MLSSFSFIHLTILWSSTKFALGDVYLSEEDGTDTCCCEFRNTSCETWDYGITQFGSSETMYIDDGIYNATSYIYHSRGSYNVIGASRSDTMIVADVANEDFWYANTPTSVVAANFTYFPKHCMDTRFAYLYSGTSTTFKNIIVNGTKCSINASSTYDMIYSYHTDNVTFDNIVFSDVFSGSESNSLFDLRRNNYVVLKDITMTTTTTGMNFGDNVAPFLYNELMLYDTAIENIYISNYYATNTFYFKNNYYPSQITLYNVSLINVYGGPFFVISYRTETNVTMTDITIDGKQNGYVEDCIIYWVYNYYPSQITLYNVSLINVYGGPFFVISYRTETNVTMKDITIDGKQNGYVEDCIIYWDYNYYNTTSLMLKDSIITNFQFISNAKGLYFHTRYYEAQTIYLENVIFENLGGSKTIYGLIYVEDDFNLFINNCTFQNNTGWVGLIQCRESTYCNVLVRNSLFINNRGRCYYGENLNGFLFDSSHATITMKNNTFYGKPVLIVDDTSIVIQENNVVYNATDTKNSDQCIYSQDILYLSPTGTITTRNESSNNCTVESNPCVTYARVLEEMEAGDTLQFESGTHELGLTIDSLVTNVTNIWQDQNYMIRGEGPETTILEVAYGVDFAWLDGYNAITENMVPRYRINFSDFTFYPLDGLDQTFIYSEYIYSIYLSNITVDGITGDTISAADVLFARYLEDYVIIENVQIYDVFTSSYELFYFRNVPVLSCEISLPNHFKHHLQVMKLRSLIFMICQRV